MKVKYTSITISYFLDLSPNRLNLDLQSLTKIMRLSI